MPHVREIGNLKGKNVIRKTTSWWFDGDHTSSIIHCGSAHLLDEVFMARCRGRVGPNGNDRFSGMATRVPLFDLFPHPIPPLWLMVSDTKAKGGPGLGLETHVEERPPPEIRDVGEANQGGGRSDVYPPEGGLAAPSLIGPFDHIFGWTRAKVEQSRIFTF